MSVGRYRAILTSILLLGAFLRFFGVTHGLELDEPQFSIWNNQNDEETQALTVRASLLGGDSLPPEVAPGVFWLWGSGGFYAYRALDRFVLPVLSFLAGLDVSHQRLTVDLAPILLSHRVIGILVVVAAIGLLARIVRREFDEVTAAVAAFLLATSYLSVRESHYGTLDPWLFLGAVVAIDRALVLARGPTSFALTIAGLTTGMFAAFKYSGTALVGPVLLGAWWSRSGAGWKRGVLLGSRDLAVILAFACVGYLVWSPTIFRDLEIVTAMFRSQQGLIGFEFARLPEMIAYHARSSIGVGFGELASLSCGIGVIVSIARKVSRSQSILLLMLLAALAALPLSNTSHSVRQALPMFPMLAIFAARGIVVLTERVRTRAFAVGLLSVLVAGPSLARGIAFDVVAGRLDTRSEVMSFLRDSGAERDDVVGVGFYGLPRQSGVATPAPFVDWLDAVHRRGVFPRERAASWRPRFVVRDLCSGVDDSWGWVDWSGVVEREYREVLRVEGRRDGHDPPLPDLEFGTPFHFVPYLQPWSMERPGPAIVVYERI